MNKLTIVILVVSMSTMLSSCSAKSKDDKHIYYLYRTSLIVSNPQFIAMFNAKVSIMSHYNKENCQIAARLFQAQPRVKTEFFCTSKFL